MRSALLALALLAIPLSAIVPAAADVPLVRVIVGHEVWEDGEFTLRNAVFVGPGATLTVRNATLWLDANRTCTQRTNLPGLYQCVPHLGIHGGTLVLEDSVVDTHRWDGHDADTGFILEVQQGVARIRGSTLQHYRQVSFVMAGDAPSTVEGTTFREGAGPVRAMQGVELSFRGNVIEDGHDGIWVSDAAPDVQGNVIRRLDRGFDLGSPRYGVWAFTSSPQDRAWPMLGSIRGNLIEGVPVGILVQAGTPVLVEENVVRQADRGISINVQADGIGVVRESPIVRRNVVENSTHGFTLSGTSSTGTRSQSHRTVDLTENVFRDIRCHTVWLRVLPANLTVDVDARATYWGDREGPSLSNPECAALRVDTAAITIDTDPWSAKEPKWVKRLVSDLESLA